jgi:hypothetical protein
MWFFVIWSVLMTATSGVLLWYSNKITKQLAFAVKNVEQYQNLLDQYHNSLEATYKLDEYYGDDTIKILITHTKMVADACKAFRYSVLDTGEEEKDESATKETKENAKQ